MTVWASKDRNGKRVDAEHNRSLRTQQPKTRVVLSPLSCRKAHPVSSSGAASDPCDGQQFLQIEQQARDTCDLVSGVLVSSASMAGDSYLTCFIDALHEIVCRI